MRDGNKPFYPIVQHTNFVPNQKCDTDNDSSVVPRIQDLGIVDVVHVVGKPKGERVSEMILEINVQDTTFLTFTELLKDGGGQRQGVAARVQ